MSIANEIERLTKAKTALKTAIEQQGVIVPDSTTLEQYAPLVEQICTGGAAEIELLETLSLTPTERSLTIDFSGFDKQEFWIIMDVPETTEKSGFALGIGNSSGTAIITDTTLYPATVYANLYRVDEKIYGIQGADNGWANGYKVLPLLPHPRTTENFMKLKVQFYPYISGEETATIKVYGR